MRKVAKPTDCAEAVFLKCISTFSEPLRTKLTGIAREVGDAAVQYEIAASTSELFSIPVTTPIRDVTIAQMKAVYTEKMVPENGPGRSIYDKLRAASPNGRCPICTVG